MDWFFISTSVVVLQLCRLSQKAKFVSNSVKCENETPSQDFEFSIDSVAKAIDQLKQTLNQNYLRAEKLMALRRPNTDELNDVWSEIDQNYKEIIETMTIAKVDLKVVATASKNKSKFELRKNEFLLLNSGTSSSETPCLSLPPEFNLQSDHDVASVCLSLGAKSTKSSKSNKSSYSTASTTSLKCLDARIELQTAQLEAEQSNERLKEQNAKADLETKLRVEMRELEAQVQIREAKRKIELAKKKLEVLDEFNENCSAKFSQNVLSKHRKVSSEPVLPLTNNK